LSFTVERGGDNPSIETNSGGCLAHSPICEKSEEHSENLG